ncbi:MAG: hypothetical protein OEY22_06460 [Candidatus Bathyarchaeota archaeon]|nr:hypothetical protein [Candidatus Bathyarchaeota archaeon]MDH5787308.1 hypothetical protein [Candidatus Bathyarchaeota archaeon]
MSEQTVPPPTQSTESQAITDATVVEKEKSKVSEEEALDSLKEVQENVGQISELAKEEENLVVEFFDSLKKILKSISRKLEISVSSLPKKYQERINKAYLYLTGQLVLVHRSEEVEILNLAEPENHGILIEILGEIMVQLKSTVSSHSSKTEKRVKFLMSVTKELQKVANVFAGK